MNQFIAYAQYYNLEKEPIEVFPVVDVLLRVEPLAKYYYETDTYTRLLIPCDQPQNNSFLYKIGDDYYNCLITNSLDELTAHANQYKKDIQLKLF